MMARQGANLENVRIFTVFTTLSGTVGELERVETVRYERTTLDYGPVIKKRLCWLKSLSF